MDKDLWFSFPSFYDFVVNNHKDFQIFVELGVWQGGSISYLANLLRDRKDQVKIYGVDVFENWKTHNTDVLGLIPNIYQYYNNNLISANVRDMIVDIKQCSWDAASQFENSSVDFVFIDADHAYESVCKDINAWLPKIKPNGMISGHDIQSTEVLRAVKENISNPIIRHDLGSVWYKTKD